MEGLLHDLEVAAGSRPIMSLDAIIATETALQMDVTGEVSAPIQTVCVCVTARRYHPFWTAPA